MLKKIAVSVLFSALLVFPIAWASVLSNISISDMLTEDLSINETLSIKILENTESSFLITPPKNAHSIKTNYNQTVSHNNTVSIVLNCKTCSIEISYVIPDVIKSETNGEYSFTRSLNLPKIPKSLGYKVSLPAGYAIRAGDETEPSIVPQPNSIETDGRAIIVRWAEENPVLPKLYSIRYVKYDAQEKALQRFGSLFSRMEVWVIIIVSLLAGASFCLLFKKFFKKKITLGFAFIPSSLLNPDEKIVISLLKKNSNKMRQKEIVRELGWSKSKVSAIMTNLEHKKIVKREKFGRNYSVELVKQIETSEEH